MTAKTPTPKTPKAKKPEVPTATKTHIYFVLDRSGSMASIANDVIGGFNTYLAQQQADGDDAVMTLVQFDSDDVHEVLADAAPIKTIQPLSSAVFVPRGGTPLYDAMGRVITEAIARETQLKGLPGLGHVDVTSSREGPHRCGILGRRVLRSRKDGRQGRQ